jgi:hypothetical protein
MFMNSWFYVILLTRYNILRIGFNFICLLISVDLPDITLLLIQYDSRFHGNLSRLKLFVSIWTIFSNLDSNSVLMTSFLYLIVFFQHSLTFFLSPNISLISINLCYKFGFSFLNASYLKQNNDNVSNNTLYIINMLSLSCDLFHNGHIDGLNLTVLNLIPFSLSSELLISRQFSFNHFWNFSDSYIFDAKSLNSFFVNIYFVVFCA